MPFVMHPDDSEVARIAAGLTKAQREAVQGRRSANSATCWNLCSANSRRPALMMFDFAGGYGATRVYGLNKTGRAVRAYLQSKGGDA